MLEAVLLLLSHAVLAKGAAIEYKATSPANLTSVSQNTDICRVFNPCMNGASCAYSSGTGRSCACAPGFTGSRCQFVDFCASSPCASTATCLTEKTKYTCLCAPGYAGRLCDLVDPCLNKTCNNGGTCVAQGTTARCDCPGPYAGPNCNTRCAPSNYGSCYGSGQECILRASGYVSCNCNSRVPRNTVSCVMEKDLVNECAALPNPCNGGRCNDLYKGFYCSRCPSGRSGERCESYNPCYISPCQNGGTCSLEGDDYVCACPRGYQGRNCQWRNYSRTCSLTCSPTAFKISCDRNHLPNLVRDATLHARVTDAQECSCRMSRYSYRRGCTIPFDGCGTKMKVNSNGTLVYHNFLAYNSIPLEAEDHESWELDVPITRSRGEFKIDFTCAVPIRFTAQKSANSKDFGPNDNFNYDMTRGISTTPLTISYFRLLNNTLHSVQSFYIGRRLYALVQVSANYDANADVQTSQLKLQDCYATPTANANSVQRYQMLQDGCVKDETFRFETKHLTDGDIRFQSPQLRSVKFKSLISFQPFTFKRLGTEIFLHCTGYLCENACNQCRDESAPRKRRHAALKHASNPLKATGDLGKSSV